MDKAYVSEDREGGVMALGDDIAGIPRDQLNAVPDALWAHEKDRFVYAAWVRHALRAASIQEPGSSQ